VSLFKSHLAAGPVVLHRIGLRRASSLVCVTPVLQRQCSADCWLHIQIQMHKKTSVLSWS